MQKRLFRFLIIILVVLCFAVVGISCSELTKEEKMQSNFDIFLNDLFVLEVQSDTLSLNYSLAAPENYGITVKETTLGEYSISHMYEEMSASENYLKRLKSFDYEQLTNEQQLTYDIIKSYLETDINLGDYMYYTECLGPTTGIQAQLPILLAEYSFYDKEDIEEYLRLLPCVYHYFEDIVQFEREKSERGLFMSDAVALRIIRQCEAFIDTPEENFLIGYFNDKISGYKGLTDVEKTYYKAMNKEAVLNDIIPAYKMLVEALYELIGTGSNDAGLYYYPDGQAYYESLAKYKAGSAKNMEEIIKMLEEAIGDGIVDLTALTISDPSILDKYLAFSSFPITDPQEIISDLKEDITKDFPAAVTVNCEIKYVPPSLSDFLSPAMYLVPPIDNYLNNNIYINGNDSKTLSMIYTTVAHEGYPGHLYQCVYFRNLDPAPIRNIMNFMGYDEGWATYVEYYSYHLAGIDENLATFLEANNKIILCMYARADIGIHYEGWTEEKVVNYVKNFINDENIAKLIYATLLEEPAIYLPYAVGYLEIIELRDKAMEELGDKFIVKDFHQFLLDIGPSQFGIIENYMETWVEKRLK
ncbi:MAG: hypothetical protein K0S76_3136 [Herbinix sp.]|jgi:uncharacterized protein (DUF885 family)|nr:hypothetical protein [Herbinix sp.]